MATLDELAERAEARRRRQGILQQTIVDDRIARIGNNMRPEAAAVLGDSRKLTVKRLENGRDYLVNEDGAVTTGVNFGRPLTDEEYRRLGTAGAAKEIYAPENRIQGVGYAESGYLSDEAMANIRRERTLKAAGTESIRDSARAINLKRRLQEAVRAESDPSAAQLEAKKRWDLTRALGGTRGAQKQVAMMGIEDARAQAERDQARTLALMSHNAALERQRILNEGNLAVKTQEGTNSLNLQPLINEGELAKQNAINAGNMTQQELINQGQLNLEGRKGENALNLQDKINEGNMAVAQQKTGMTVADLQKRGDDILNLITKMNRGEAASPTEQLLMTNMLSNMKISDKDKAAYLNGIQNNNLAPFLKALADDYNATRRALGLQEINHGFGATSGGNNGGGGNLIL